MHNKKAIKQENPSSIQETYRRQATDEEELLSLLCIKSGRSRTAAKKLLATSKVSVNGKVTTRAEQILPIGSLITIHKSPPALPFKHPLLEIVWQNEEYLVIHKAAGIPTVNTSHTNREETAVWILSQHLKKNNPLAKLFMVNRLDRSTAGFVIFAKSIPAKEAINRQWKQHIGTQVFVACVEGTKPEETPIHLASVTENEKGEQRTVTAEMDVVKSSKAGGMHIVKIKVLGTRIFSIRKILGDNNYRILGDVRSGSSYQSKKQIALEQIVFEIKLPKTKQQLHFERTFPSHYYTYLKEDKYDKNNI